MDVLQNMMLFSELVKCGGNVYTSACPIPLLSNSSPRSVQIPRTMTIKKLSKMVCMEYMR